MILTFLFFVGIAVATVGLYITFVLRNEVQISYQQTMFQQVSRVASVLEDADSNANRLEKILTMSQMGDIQIDVAVGDSVVINSSGMASAINHPLFNTAEMQFSSGTDVNHVEREVSGQHVYFSALQRPGSGMIVRVRQPSPLLFRMINRLQFTMVAAMIMALLLAVFGSWIAAQRVTEPLQTIRNSARSISEGRLDEEITVDSRASEFQDLAKSLNLMSDTFKEKIDELQRMAHLQNEFIGNVSHEVRNPIFAVGGYLEALASSTLS
ncbi:MAG TPA: sensor histidine kinase, partial [Bacteroidetes bacterium]|nr:sensor histidine kinase [Bacteroidota bacterium]